MSESVDRVAIRRSVRETVQESAADYAERETLINEVAAATDHPTETVRRELKELERNGFVYLVGGDDGPTEVKLP